MKEILFILIFIFNYTNIVAQTTFFSLEKEAVTGYIFQESFEPIFFKIKNMSSRFTPSKFDIVKAEQLISIFDLKRRKYNKKQRRQYLGYNRGNVKYLFVHVMGYESEKQFSYDFPNWNIQMEPFLTESGREKSFLYLINLTENTIGYHRDDF